MNSVKFGLYVPNMYCLKKKKYVDKKCLLCSMKYVLMKKCCQNIHIYIYDESKWINQCNIMAEGFRFMPLGLFKLRTFRLSAWVT